MKFLTIFLLLILAACAPSSNDQTKVQGTAAAKTTNPYCASDEQIPASNGLPTILVIGDSISIGYTPTLISNFSNYDVVHNPCNAMESTWALSQVDGWLAGRDRFEAITFNNGMWDIADWVGTSDELYAANLKAIAQKVQAKTDHPIFILTTEVLADTPHRVNADVIHKNDLARQVMADLGIPVFDLYTVSLGLEDQHVNANDVHYTVDGYKSLGDAVAQEITQEVL